MQKRLEKIDRAESIEQLRLEFKLYNDWVKSIHILKNWYTHQLENFDRPIREKEEQLKSIKQSYSDGIPTAKKDRVRYNAIINSIDQYKMNRQQWIKENNYKYLSALNFRKRRCEIIEAYLEMLNDNDRAFICDLYINQLKIKRLMDKYKIENPSSVNRKGRKILEKLL